MTRYKVAHVINMIGVGGAERMLLNIANATRDSCEHSFYTLKRGSLLEQQAVELGFPVRSIRHIWKARNAHLLVSWLYYSNVVSCVFSSVFRVPHLAWIQNSVRGWERADWRIKAARKLMIRLSQTEAISLIVACGSRTLDEHIELGAPRDKGVVILNAAPEKDFRFESSLREAYRSNLPIRSDTHVFICPARVDPQKDHSLLLRVLQALSDLSDVHLILLGRGTSSTDDEIGRLGVPIPGNVTLLGPRDDVAGWLCASDTYVLASRFGEGVPLSLCEALANGLPAIVSDTGDSAEVVGDQGMVVPVANEEALLAAMLAMVRSPRKQIQDSLSMLENSASRFLQLVALHGVRRGE